MPFIKIETKSARSSKIDAPRFRVAKVPNALAGTVALPPEIVSELGWKEGVSLDILQGTEDDAGWMCLAPSDEAKRGKVKVNPTGAAYYTSTFLAQGYDTPLKSTDVKFEVQGDQFLFQLPNAA